VANNETNAAKMQANQRQFRGSCGYGGAMRGALPNEAHPGLHSKPLDAAICHQASSCITLLRRPPWLMILVENTKH